MMTRAPTQGRMLKEGLTLAGKEGAPDCTALSFFPIVFSHWPGLAILREISTP